MNRKTLGALIALNLALLGAMAALSFTPRAQGAAMVRGDYTMISANVAGRDSQAMIFVTELRTGRIAAFFYNSAQNEYQQIDGRTISDDVTAISGGR